MNVAGEEDSKHCHTICIEVENEGEWPQVLSVLSLGCEKTYYAGGKQYEFQTLWIGGRATDAHRFHAA